MKYIKGLDALRGISILFVIITHIGLYDILIDGTFFKKHYNLYSGATGVMIFFTLSGFLITLLLLNEKRKKGKINFKNFFIRRFLRLLPPLIIFFIVVFFLMYFNFIKKDYLALLISFFYLYNFIPLKHYLGELGHTWSLAVEEQFYLLWPFVISYFKKFRYLIVTCLITILISIVIKTVYLDPIHYNGKSIYLFDYFFPNRWFLPACLPIMTGAIGAILLFKYNDKIKPFFNSYLIVLLSFLLYSSQLYINNLSFVLIDFFQPIGITMFLIWIYYNQNSKLVSILNFRPIVYLGKISYGVYVYQGLFLRTGPGGELFIQKYPLNIILVFLTAVLSYHFIEKRILSFKNQFN